MAQTHKVCNGCDERLPLDQFVKERRRRLGVSSLCRPCGAAADRAKRSKNPELYRKHKRRARKTEAGQAREKAKYLNGGKFRMLEQQMLKLYGVDFHDWALMFERQNGLCGVCGFRLTMDFKTHVDHDHETGKVRGLLCHKCNILLGHLRLPPREIAERVCRYLGAM